MKKKKKTDFSQIIHNAYLNRKRKFESQLTKEQNQELVEKLTIKKDEED